MLRVVLSFALPFAIIPPVMFTRRKDLMGILANRRITTVHASTVAAIILVWSCLRLTR